MVDHGYMFDYYEPSRITPWTMSYDGSRRLYDEGGGTTPSDASLKTLPYSAMDSNSYQSLLSLRSSTIPPKDVASIRAFSTTVASSVPSLLSSLGSTGSSTGASRPGGPGSGPVLSTPMPIFSLAARRKREAEFFQAEYIPVEKWRADRCLAAWGPPSDQPYYEVEWLRVARGRQPAATIVADGVYDSTSDCSSRTTTAAAAAADTAPTWACVDESSYESTESTTVMATDVIEDEWARNVQALSRELDGWSTTSSVLSPLSSDLSSVDLSTPSPTTACSLDAWDCETQIGEDTDVPVASKSVLRGVYDLLAAIFCSRRREKETAKDTVEVKKNVDVKLDRGYSYD